MNKQAKFQHLRESILDYTKARPQIRFGLDEADRIDLNRRRILKRLGATQRQWDDYHWQLKNRITTAQAAAELLGLSSAQAQQIAQVSQTYRFAVSPYYLSLIDPTDPGCPIRRQSIPSIAEMDASGSLDPMDEQGWSPCEGVTRRYPDRLIIKVTNVCGMYCRFCQRRRMIGEKDEHTGRGILENAIAYVRSQPEIRDVLITGGDAFMLSDQTIDWLLTQLRSIEHVEIIRFGTRTPVTLPQRITPELVSVLQKHHPIFVNTHFNSPAEITPESKAACERLANAGIPLGNQMVLLNGVNNDPLVVRKMNQALLRIRVKPYYIFHAKSVRGTAHFWTPIEEGLEIMESLRGHTSGMAIPTYIINGPKGLGKTPILPSYLLCLGKEKAIFRNWSGEVFEVANHPHSEDSF